jgi:SAM-dependent methyltransferase
VPDNLPKLYTELASWWQLLSPTEEYVEEAACYWQMLSSVGLPSSPTFLELGCGGGNNAFHLKRHFASLTLTDASSQMLEVSRLQNPECEHIQGDMRALRLHREFDVVFVHDAIEFMTTADDLRRAIETAFVHCKKGGAALFVPDHVRETFQPTTDHGGYDGKGRALRYLEWTFDPDTSDTSCVVEFAYLLREGDQPARVEHERCLYGLFPRAEWLRMLATAGFQAERIVDAYKRDVFLARKP